MDTDSKKRNRERMRAWRSKHADEIKARRKKAYMENTNGLRDKMKAYYEANKKHLIEAAQKWKKANPDSVKKSRLKRQFKNIERGKSDRMKLTEAYVVDLIKGDSTLSKAAIRENKELIESYRYQIKIKRLLKTKKHGS